jgi:PPOX class probable FMN-dependent enzyme
MRRFIALSPFLCLGTSSSAGADVTPRGDSPGFVRVADDETLLIPDWPGNNRLDSLTNVTANPSVGLLFFIPGVNETLRINGVAAITMDASVLERWTVNGKHPRSAMRVTVREAYLHCAKALMRSKLWSGDYRIERTELPSYAQMLKDQGVTTEPVEKIQASIDESYRNRLY